MVIFTNNDIETFCNLDFSKAFRKSLIETGKQSLLNDFDKAKEVLKPAINIDFESPYMSRVRNNANNIIDYVKQINKILLENNGSKVEFQSLNPQIQIIQGNLNNIKAYFVDVIPYLNYGVNEVSIDKAVQLSSEAEKEKNRIEDIVKEAESKAENLITKKIINRYKDQFKTLSDDYKKISIVWRNITVGYSVFFLVLLLIIFIGETFSFGDIPIISLRDVDSISNLGLRFAIISILGWGLWFCSRNYSINKNQEIVYIQKHNLIQVYLAYINVFDESGVSKDNISVELGKILFGIERPGYVKSKGEGTHDVQPALINNLGSMIKPE